MTPWTTGLNILYGVGIAAIFGLSVFLHQEGEMCIRDSVKVPLSYFRKIMNDYFDVGEIEVYQKKLLEGISKVCLLYTSRCV